MTLAEFLLARIGEDEAGAGMMLKREDNTEWLGFLPGRGRFADWMLAKCDADRRIVQQYEQAFQTRRAHPDDIAAAGALLALHGAVKLLALPFADHPDFQEEWRV